MKKEYKAPDFELIKMISMSALCLSGTGILPDTDEDYDDPDNGDTI